MLVLALESSCDETSAAVVRCERAADGTSRCLLLSNIIASQHELHAEYAGVVPEIASRAHVEAILPVVREALAHAGVGLGMLDAIAVGNRPGLIGSLLVGVAAAKSLAWSLQKPLIGVDHVLAHLYAGVLTLPHPLPTNMLPAHAHPLFPALGLVVSGGHTSLYLVRSWNDVTRLGATIDDAMGEAYDKVAKLLGLPQPGGPNLDALARTPGADDRAVNLPVSRLSPTSLDFSFSGLKTAMLYAIKGVPDHGKHAPHGTNPSPISPPPAPTITPAQRANLAASFQRAACQAITLKLARAHDHLLAHSLPVKTLLTGGGVTANSRLRAELQAFAAARTLHLALPSLHLCMDNAGMIAGLGAELLQAGHASDLSLQAIPTAAH